MTSESEKSGKSLPEGAIRSLSSPKSGPDSKKGWPIWRDIATAFIFLTRIPMPYYERPLARAAWAFPLVGWIIGALGALAFVAASYVGLTGWVAAVIALSTTIILTGALHEDGFADMADGFWGGFDKEKRLEIMRDSSIGAYGTIALILNISLRAGALATLFNPMLVLVVMIAAHGLSRAGMAVVMAHMSPAGKSGIAASVGKVSKGQALCAAVLGLLPFACFVPFQAAALLALLPILAAVIFLQIMKRKIGGYNGDSLGALGQVIEISTYLGMVAVGNSVGFAFTSWLRFS